MRLNKKEKAIFAKGCAVGAVKQKASARRLRKAKRMY